jgi:hypothetical protein
MQQQATMALDIPAAPPAKGATMITLGGSHRAISKAVTAFLRANIRHKWLGPVNINSKRHNYAIPTADLERALALNVGASRSRQQWEWLADTDIDTYFAAAADS